MNKIMKNLITCIAALSLFTTVGVVSALADDEPSSDPSPPPIVRTLTTDFLGVGGKTTELTEKKRLGDGDAGSVFWIGVAADNLNSHELFTNGIYSFEIAFEYNTDYVIPYNDNNGNPNGEWNAKIKEGNFVSEMWDSSIYELTTSIDKDLNLHKYRQGLTEAQSRNATGKWRMCTIEISADKSKPFTSARFLGLDSADKQYFVKVPFIVKKTPSSSDADDNPTVLALVKGPETFDIGADSDGANPHYEWYDEFNSEDEDLKLVEGENLRLLFDDKAVISLFGSGDTITDIIPLNVTADATPSPDSTEAPASPEPKPTLPPLSSDKEKLQGDGFAPTTYNYYLSVPNEVETIQLEIKSSLPVTVAANGESPAKNATEVTNKNYKSHEIALLELNKDTDSGGEADGFNNKVVVSDGTKTYTIYIRRLLKPKIVLNYGNSPYGEIMRMTTLTDDEGNPSPDRWTEEFAADAKKKFINENNFSYTEEADKKYIPNDVLTYVTYTLSAWNDHEESDVNMDRNDYALFIYDRQEFTDPGFTAFSADGTAVTEITRKITVKRMSQSSVASLVDHDYVDDEITPITNSISEYKFTEITSEDDPPIVPAVYTMEYSFVDPILKKEVTETRPIVVLWNLGDADMSNQVNAQDIPTIYSIIKNKIKISQSAGETVTEEEAEFSKLVENLYFYRIVDADMSNQVNSQDIPTIYSIIKNKMTSKIYI